MHNPTIPHCLPNDISPEQFLAEYWQKKPLLIKQGLPQLAGMFEPDDILGLALEEEVTARLITQTKTTNPANQPHPYQWQVKKSPLAESDFEPLINSDNELWTVLVQNLEQWSPELGQLWHAFDFIPSWQRDDIMVSYAPQGASVGKHYDDYDVFLAQGYGHRRWQLGKYCDETTEFVEGQPIRIFDDMGEIIFDEVLQAGDVLYVPPKLSHFGVAEDECLTFSFGFRRPNLMQVLDGLADIATSESSLFVPMLLEQTQQPAGQLSQASISAIKQQLIVMLNSPLGERLITQTVSEVVSKRQYDILTPEDMLSTDEMLEALTDGASIQADYNSRLLYVENKQNSEDTISIYANGQPLADLTSSEIQALKRLADGECLYQEDLANIDPDNIMEWLENSWAWLDTTMFDDEYDD
ncbi:cupin domain-containing protein [Psychrobacter sp. I-STPA6b]|uniref:cupin domain-containing protein n=1 Tax=Psychrobacter sp. I-STPA6b TaxID=2585718 RepID=UPI001D0C17A3|nr:cupin domain-containing protein [Psychrobacter sp. I-STPA6b]